MKEFKQGEKYSEEVINAVRYGYQYRKEAEGDGESRLHYFLPETSEVLLWLGSAILSGIAWDVIKGMAIKTYNKFKEKNQIIDKDTENILKNESELKVFYEYVIEFSEHRMSISEQQKKHIKEEILADYHAKKETEIMEKYGRFATVEERKIIIKEAFSFAESLLREHK